MTRILILRANGQLARNAIPVLLRQEGVALTLYLRRDQRMANPDPGRVRIVEGDVLDRKGLDAGS